MTPDGKGKAFFKSDETHVRSMTLDAQDNLIVGTEPGGLVMRVSPAGEGFVLYQMSKREVTAVAVAPDGTIYAAAVGNKQGGGGLRTRPRRRPSPRPLAATATVNPPGAAAPVPSARARGACRRLAGCRRA